MAGIGIVCFFLGAVIGILSHLFLASAAFRHRKGLTAALCAALGAFLVLCLYSTTTLPGEHFYVLKRLTFGAFVMQALFGVAFGFFFRTMFTSEKFHAAMSKGAIPRHFYYSNMALLALFVIGISLQPLAVFFPR